MSRDPVTASFYPDKMSVEEFVEEITNSQDNQNFIQNMRHLKMGTKYPEEWIQIYAAWKEMNK